MALQPMARCGALRHRATLDGNDALGAFCDKLEAAARETVEAGIDEGHIVILPHPGLRFYGASRRTENVRKLTAWPSGASARQER